MSYDGDFRKHTRRRRLRSGRYVVACRLGNWRVEAATKEQAEQEARHYFALYAMDGLYETHNEAERANE